MRIGTSIPAFVSLDSNLWKEPLYLRVISTKSFILLYTATHTGPTMTRTRSLCNCFFFSLSLFFFFFLFFLFLKEIFASLIALSIKPLWAAFVPDAREIAGVVAQVPSTGACSFVRSGLPMDVQKSVCDYCQRLKTVLRKTGISQTTAIGGWWENKKCIFFFVDTWMWYQS